MGTLYAYKDIDKYVDDFEDNLVMSITEFIRMEAKGFSSSNRLLEGRMSVVRTFEKIGTRLVASESSSEAQGSCSSIHGKSSASHNSHYKHAVEESLRFSQRRTGFELLGNESLDEVLEEELIELLEAKEAEVTYIVGNTYIRTRRHSSRFK